MITVLVALVIAGVVVYLVNALIPMDARFKMALNVFLFLYMLQVLGLWSPPANLLR